MKFVLLFMLFFLANNLSAQKRSIDNKSYLSWERLSRYDISNDAKYAWYSYTSGETVDTIVIISLFDHWEKRFEFREDAGFTSDSRALVFNSKEGIVVLELQSRVVKVIKGGTDFKLSHLCPNLIIYRDSTGIFVKDLYSGNQASYNAVEEYWFNPNGSILIIKQGGVLKSLSLKDFRVKDLDKKGRTVRNIAFNKTGDAIAYIVKDGDKDIVRYYDCNKNILYDILGMELRSKEQKISDDPLFFSDDETTIFFKIGKLENSKALHDSSIVYKDIDVWHYKDKYLQEHQIFNKAVDAFQGMYAAVNIVKPNSVINLEDDEFRIEGTLGKYALTKKRTNEQEVFWNCDEIPSYKLISTRSGACEFFLSPSKGNCFVSKSKYERFVIWCDSLSQQWYSYDIQSKIKRCITQGIPVSINEGAAGRKYKMRLYFAGWMAEDSTLLLYDRFDIWKVDPTGVKTPSNITSGYGRRHNIALRFITNDLDKINLDSFLLCALDETSKRNGFFKVLNLKSGYNIVEYNMNKKLYYFPNLFVSDPPAPKKALYREVYLLQEQSASSSPNLVWTRDFRKFNVISNINPERKYNWITAELIEWQVRNGESRKGILYKPENYDSTKKYPIIFHYYEMRSNELHQYKFPGLSTGNLNIPWFVSNGYFVFIPDIWQETGFTGMSVLNSVETAADYLIGKYKSIDTSKMGLQGHSFGGYETNYIVTHSKRFAAACSFAGPSDLVSFYGSLGFNGNSLAFFCEQTQLNIGHALWERPDLFIDNSPIFSTSKVTTPLLLIHNKYDDAVPFNQSIEFFTALRRLKKKVWLLQYDGQGHVLDDNSPASLDFTIRMEQFFNHYLKGMPPPEWLVKGIPAELKGLRAGLNSNVEGR